MHLHQQKRRRTVPRSELRWTCPHCGARRGEQCRYPILNRATVPPMATGRFGAITTGVHLARRDRTGRPELPISLP